MATIEKTMEATPAGLSFRGVFKKLLGEGSLYSLQPVMNSLIRFFLIPLYTAYLTPEDYGNLQFVMVSGMIALAVLRMGLPAAFWKFRSEPGKYNVKEVLLNIIVLQLSAGVLLVMAGAVLKALLFRDSLIGTFILVFLCSRVLCMGLVSIQLLLRSQHRVKLYLTTVLTNTLGLALLNIFFIAGLHLNYQGVIYSNLIVSVLVLLLFSPLLKGHVGGRLNTALSVEMLRYGYPMMLSNIAAFSISFSSWFLLKWLNGSEELGLFSYGNKFADLMNIFMITPLALAWNPLRWDIYRMPNGKEIFSRLCHMASAFFPLAGLLILAGTAFIGDVMARNKDYTEGLIVLAPLIFAKVFYALYYFESMGMLFENKTKVIRNIIFICSAICILANLVLIPLCGRYGAALAALLAYAVMYLAGRCYGQRCYPIQRHLLHEGLQIGLVVVYVVAGTCIIKWSGSLPVRVGLILGLAVLHLTGNWLFSRTFRNDARSGAALIRSLCLARAGSTQ